MPVTPAQIAAARAEVRKHKFGTPDYDAAFDALGTLTRKAADEYRGEYNSIDGDVFAPRSLEV